MTSVLRYLTGFFSADTFQPGLIQKLDGTVWLVAPDGTETQLSGGTGYLTRRPMLFTESSGSGVYEASVMVPPGTSILDVAVFCLAGPWQAATADLVVGDEFDDDGYIPAIDLVAGLNSPYENENPRHGTDWSDPNIAGGAYGQAANWYAAGNAIYTPTVRYPNGATITAKVTAQEGGPIVASDIEPPDGFGGISYAPGDTGTIDQGSNSTATYRVDTVDGEGAILTYTITDPGTGYFPAAGVGTTATSGSGHSFSLNITEVDASPVTDPGIVVVDVIGFGVPAGPAVVPTKS